MRRVFVAAGYGHRVGKGWTTTQIYEYAGFSGIDSVADALENMRQYFRVTDQSGNDMEFELEGWEDKSCPGCTVNTCVQRKKSDLRQQPPIFEDNLLTIYPRCRNTRAYFIVDMRRTREAYTQINKIFNNPEAYYRMGDIKTLYETLDIAYKIETNLGGEPSSIMRLAALREEARIC